MARELIERFARLSDHRKELARACVRIDAPGHIEWLLWFYGVKLDALSVGDKTNLVYEMASFSVFGSGVAGEEAERTIFDGAMPDIRIIKNLQACLGRHIRTLLRHGESRVVLRQVSFLIRHGVFTPGASLRDAFLYRMGGILAENIGRILPCAECRTLFAAKRRGQVYCGRKCLNRVKVREWRAKQRTKRGSRKRLNKGHGHDGHGAVSRSVR